MIDFFKAQLDQIERHYEWYGREVDYPEDQVIAIINQLQEAISHLKHFDHDNLGVDEDYNSERMGTR